MIFWDKRVRPSIKTFCDNMKGNYKDWRQEHYSFENIKKWHGIWTASWPTFIKLNRQSKSMYTWNDRKYIFESIQDTINLQLNDKDFDITK